jgi:hypothetical protein
MAPAASPSEVKVYLVQVGTYRSGKGCPARPRGPPSATSPAPAAAAAPWPASWSSRADDEDEDNEEELAPKTPPAASKTSAAAVVEGVELAWAPPPLLAASGGPSLASLFPLKAMEMCSGNPAPSLMQTSPASIHSFSPSSTCSAAREILSSSSQQVQVPRAKLVTQGEVVEDVCARVGGAHFPLLVLALRMLVLSGATLYPLSLVVRV